ncbi:UDP-N-acetyl-alpha-D-glucosamine C6 dehydratase [Adhaeretor mobilis]|uniref:UDP-N-acetyl-alpha-D-glucosamine C6 dehydratase n=2 Tax=Adhaeretor mobilis TaxID=1930276 RepID=A0A517MPY9_9BACT|nr:UDP-N-acetyl-alpha-D-glucosamine C6 dehydratase [Adhaeretor mobilis]
MPNASSENSANAQPTPPASGKAAGRWHSARQLLIQARIPLLVIGHALVFVAAYWLAFLLRFDFSLDQNYQSLFLRTLPLLVIVKLATFYVAGHFHGWWRYVTFTDLVTLFRAATIATAILAGLDYFLFPYQVPRSVVILDWGLTILAIGALRSVCRIALEQSLKSKSTQQTQRALIVGNSFECSRLGQLISSRPEWGYEVVGQIGLNGEAKKSRFAFNAQLAGSIDQLAEVAEEKNASVVLLRAGLLPGATLRQLMDDCTEAGLQLKVIPDLKDHLDGSHKVPMRDIEITDLLHRDPVQLDTSSINHLIEGKTVMVTGAGGSIGSELCRQIMKFNPHSLILLGRGENRIFKIDLELRALNTDTVIEARIASVTDERRMRAIFEAHRPDIIFHAAAHKHVPLMEENVAEAVQNNVLGTKTVADLANEFAVGTFVFISTDKAVNPTSVMGCTKQLGERYVMALAADTPTRFMVTRFGNVLGSNGSVVPLFKRQIENGGPITVTDARMTRFFMTIPEASQLVLQAAAIGEDGQIVVLDMGEQIKVIDMARDLIRLAGLPEHAIDIEVTGIRPGEKLYEELFDDHETTVDMPHPKLNAARYVRHTVGEVTGEIESLIGACGEGDEALRDVIRSIVLNYASSEELSSEPDQCDTGQSEAVEHVAVPEQNLPYSAATPMRQ